MAGIESQLIRIATALERLATALDTRVLQADRVFDADLVERDRRAAVEAVLRTEGQVLQDWMQETTAARKKHEAACAAWHRRVAAQLGVGDEPDVTRIQ